MIRLLLIALILLTGCDKQGEDMTIFPFLEVDTAAFTTNVTNPYPPYDWKTHNFSTQSVCTYKGSLYDVTEESAPIYKPYTKMVMRSGDRVIYGESVYEVTNDMDRTVNNKEIIYEASVLILPNLNLPIFMWKRYNQVFKDTGKKGQEVIVLVDTQDELKIKVRNRYPDLYLGGSEETIRFHSPTVNSEGIKVYELELHQVNYNETGDVVSSPTIDLGMATLIRDYSTMVSSGDTMPIQQYYKPYLYIDGILYRVYNVSAPGDLGIPPPSSNTESWGIQPSYNRISDVVSFKSVLPEKMVFDDTSYTTASAMGRLYYDNIVPTDGGEFRMVALYSMVADRYKVTFDNGEVHEGTIPLTEAGITRFIKADSTTSHARIDLYRADGKEVLIGGIGISRESIDMGGAKFSADGTMNDYSPYETRKGGVVDYRPGITTFKDGVTTIIPIEDDRTLENLRTTIKRIKRRRLAFDIGDAWYQKDDINVAMQVVARAESISYNLRSGSGKDDPTEYIEVRWKIGESS